MTTQREVKRIRSPLVAVKAGETNGSARAIVAHVNRVDNSPTRDVVLPGATQRSEVLMTTWDHTGQLPPGRGKIYEQGSHVLFDAQFFPTTTGQEYRKTLIGGGDLIEWSVECLVLKQGTLTDAWKAMGAKRVIESWRIVGVAPVLIGAMPDTGTVEIKCDGCCTSKRGGGSPSGSLFDDPAKRAFVASLARKLEPPRVTPADLKRIDRRMAEIISSETPVTETQQRTAHAWARAVERELGLPPVTIKWKIFSAKWDGCFDPAEPTSIFLNPRIAVERIPEVVCHEMGHYGRHLRGWRDTEPLVERDANDLLALLGAA